MLSKEAQLYDLLRMKNDMIIKQNLERIMIGHGGSGGRGGMARRGSNELIMEEDGASGGSSEGEEDRLEMDNTPVYNLKKTRFMH